jgi:hypothetical protein
LFLLLGFWIMPPEIRGSGGIFSEVPEACFSLADPRGDLLEKLAVWSWGLPQKFGLLEPGAVPGDVTKYHAPLG